VCGKQRHEEAVRAAYRTYPTAKAMFQASIAYDKGVRLERRSRYRLVFEWRQEKRM
jgi:hypothetical protein